MTRPMPLYRRALEATERVLGAEAPDTLLSLNNLAALQSKLGRNGQAEPLYRRALEAKERVLGKEHPATLTRSTIWQSSMRPKAAMSEAKPLYWRGVEASERVLGKEHPQTLAGHRQSGDLAFFAARLGRRRRVLAARHRRDHPAHAARGAEHGAHRQDAERGGAMELAVLGPGQGGLSPEGRKIRVRKRQPRRARCSRPRNGRSARRRRDRWRRWRRAVVNGRS